MKQKHLVFFLTLFFATGLVVAEEQTRSLPLPPASLAEWYPPANKRQVWLHTMFSLRRSMQAVTEYQALEDYPLAEKWVERFVRDYRQLAVMVPEWADEIEDEQAERLLEAVQQKNAGAMASALNRLSTSCRSCHNENRAIVTFLYRMPEYHEVTVEDSETLDDVPYPDHMARLGSLMNRIKIAQEDGRFAVAGEAGTNFIAAVKDLSGSCGGCHRDDAPRQRIFGLQSAEALDKLGQGLREQDSGLTDEALGTLGAFTCGRCHSIHRNSAELRRALLPVH